MPEKRPSTEFQAFFAVVAVLWGTLIVGVMCNIVEVVVPDNITPHAVMIPLSFIFILVGAFSLVAWPIYWIWGIASGRYGD